MSLSSIVSQSIRWRKIIIIIIIIIIIDLILISWRCSAYCDSNGDHCSSGHWNIGYCHEVLHVIRFNGRKTITVLLYSVYEINIHCNSLHSCLGLGVEEWEVAVFTVGCTSVRSRLCFWVIDVEYSILLQNEIIVESYWKVKKSFLI